MGDRISQIQFACSGKEVGIAEVRIIEIDPSEVSSFHRKTEFVDAYLKQRKVPQYHQFRRNAAFPFGVISTIGAGNSANAAFSGRRHANAWRMISVTSVSAASILTPTS